MAVEITHWFGGLPETDTGQPAAIDRSLARFAHVDDLADLQAAVLACARCTLRQGCQRVVFGEGGPAAGLMLIGEGPGAQEDELGRPFVGRAGQLLDRILQAAGFCREGVYIANVVKCRPPGNRAPTPEERLTCLPNLYAQVRLIKPRILVLMGATALQSIVDSRARITHLRGQWLHHGGYAIMPTFHPAALLRDETKKRPAWEDWKKIRDYYRSTYDQGGGSTG